MKKIIQKYKDYKVVDKYYSNGDRLHVHYRGKLKYMQQYLSKKTLEEYPNYICMDCNHILAMQLARVY